MLAQGHITTFPYFLATLCHIQVSRKLFTTTKRVKIKYCFVQSDNLSNEKNHQKLSMQQSGLLSMQQSGSCKSSLER